MKKTTAEVEAEEMLCAYENGEIDNAFDVIDDVFELLKTIPKDAPIRARFEEMACELEAICAACAKS